MNQSKIINKKTITLGTIIIIAFTTMYALIINPINYNVLVLVGLVHAVFYALILYLFRQFEIFYIECDKLEEQIRKTDSKDELLEHWEELKKLNQKSFGPMRVRIIQLKTIIDNKLGIY